MRFEKITYCVIFASLWIAFLIVFRLPCVIAGAISDRVVAFVDTTAITLSELEDRYAETIRMTPNVTREEVLNTLINRTLMIREARKIRLKSEKEDELLNEYINLKIRAFVRIQDEAIREFYAAHVSEFGGRQLDDVREDIENYLVEQEVNNRLKQHIAGLRANSCIRVQLDPEKQSPSSCPRCN